MSGLSTPRRLRLFVSLVGVAAAVATTAAAERTTPPVPPHWVALPLVVLLVVVGERFEVRYQFRGAVEAFTIVEAGIAPLIVGFPVLVAVLAVAFAQAVVSVVGRNNPLKSVFNVAQWSLATALAGLTVSIVAGPAPSQTLLVGSLLAGLATLSLVNQVTCSTVISLARAPEGVGSFSPVLLGLRGANQVAVLCFAVLAAAAYLWRPWAIVFFFPPLLLLHAAGRGVAAVQVDRRRLGALQEVTHHLAASLDPQVALPQVLRAIRRAFEVRAVELLIDRDGRRELHQLLESGYRQQLDTETDAAAAVPLADSVRDAGHPVRLATPAGHPALARAGWHDCLAVPLRSGGRPIGVLCLYDRTGMVGFEEGEVSVAVAIAAEIVGFVERSVLIDSVGKERRTLADIVGSTSDGILTLTDDGRIETWNAGLEAITGYRAADMVGTAHFGLLRPRDPAGADLYFERWADTAVTLPNLIQVRTAHGEAAWLSCSYTPVPAQPDRPARLVVVARNTTDEHELEQLKDDFVAVVSHELRTPLSSIKGWTTTLLSRRERMTAEQQQHGLEAINRQAHRLEQLVLNILEASRIESGTPVVHAPVDVAHVVAKVVEDVTALYPSRTVRVSGTTTPALALGQQVWVERAVANLVYNAVKYSADDEPVDVSVDWTGTEVAVAVVDRGPGIPPDALERIFDRFERLPGAATQTGTGLGLYITRQLVTAMAGTVDVQSTVGAGSRFTLRLRAAALRVPDQPRGPRMLRAVQ